MAGLPGAGKSALADALGRRTGWPVLSVDPVDAALLEAGIGSHQPTGLAAYNVVDALAGHLLRLGQTVVVDAVNAAAEARAQWVDLAERTAVPLQFVEVVCSDAELHRQRLEGRQRRLAHLPEPRWESLEQRRAQLLSWSAGPAGCRQRGRSGRSGGGAGGRAGPTVPQPRSDRAHRQDGALSPSRISRP